MKGKWIGVFTSFFAFVTTGFLEAAQDAVPAHYYWKASPAGSSAQLVTLFCRSCEDAGDAGRDIPLVAVLRDTLGGVNSEGDRISYVWLLTYSAPTWEKRVLSAVPFFYWRVGDGSGTVGNREPKPLMNLTQPRRPVVSSAVRNILQWSVLDPVSMTVRASSRSYQNNWSDHERLHLEEAESYLQSAQAADDDSGLSETELNTVIARLELRKSMLGGFVSANRAEKLGEDANLEQERIRARNWELLRQCADKTGLLFEPIDLAGAKNQYAVLWYPVERSAPPDGIALGPIWKLLNLKDPYEERDRLQRAPRYDRTLDGQTAQMVPLGVYSLTYPKMPLLVIDFRDGSHLRWHELTQRAINEITSGLIGISHFTNWYYFIGADIYDFYAARRGAATNLQERLNCYSKFRVALALDKSEDPALLTAMRQRVRSLAVNPLETATQREMQAALQRYDLLEAAAANENSKLAMRLNKDRRAELARFETPKGGQVRGDIWHAATFGVYTQRAAADGFSERLEEYREVDYYLRFLNGIEAAGTEPEVAYDSARIRFALVQLSVLLPDLKAGELRERAARTIEKLRGLSADAELKAECTVALDSLSGTRVEALEGSGKTETLR
jgi:hypothetical protein